ncbi:hypothetical protein Dsin_021653 [Dipteronia sinensis]|uniref:Uncharacterized protein n=1 Tax=Dipteronia sinensis TaxID=43782 RepID=A0AAD9ZZY2_9ROSI|nr:hypothetical protein Dsin_021653 [Dipteronia sinensis]
MHFLQHSPHTRLYKLSFFMGCLRTTPTPSFTLQLFNINLSSYSSSSTSSKRHFFHTCRRLVPVSASKHINNNHALVTKTNGRLSHTSPANFPNPDYSEDTDGKRLTVPPLTILKSKLTELGIDIGRCAAGAQNRLVCPMCKGGDSEEQSLSLSIDQDGHSAVWVCFRAKCGWRGSTRALAHSRSLNSSFNRISNVKTPRHFTEESLELEPLCDQLIGYFSERLITRWTLERNRVMQKRYGDNEIAIAFTYRRKGKLLNCKYRDINKRFWQEKDAEKILYGLDDIEGASEIVIVEGEIDMLSMEEAGIYNCVSVPDGAPPKVSQNLPSEDQDTKYEYLWNCKDYLMKASRIILATDGDLPGQALAEELARRLGRERCWRVRWPKKNEVDHFKDANEVLMYLGADALKEVVENAELYPIKGLFSFRDFFDEIDSYYYRTVGDEFGISTGWRGVDPLYNVVPGELTIVTGVPNSGKSEWIDALLCNINESVGWKFALCSMENKVREHARKLLEKHLKKPFFNASYGQSVERMTVEEFEQGKEWLGDTFSLIRCENDSLPSISWVLELAKAAVLRHGVRGLVIDPYNELDHQRPSNITETEYVSQMLTKIKRFALHHSVHVWFVAHPRQLHQWVGGPPNLYDISGSAHFINKCDNGIVVHRNRDPEAGPMDRVQVGIIFLSIIHVDIKTFYLSPSFYNCCFHLLHEESCLNCISAGLCAEGTK